MRYYQSGNTKYTDQFVPFPMDFAIKAAQNKQAKSDKVSAAEQKLLGDAASLEGLRKVTLSEGTPLLLDDQNEINDMVNKFNTDVDGLANIAYGDKTSSEFMGKFNTLQRKYQKAISPNGKLGRHVQRVEDYGTLEERRSKIEHLDIAPWLATNIDAQYLGYANGDTRYDKFDTGVSTGKYVDRAKEASTLLTGIDYELKSLYAGPNNKGYINSYWRAEIDDDKIRKSAKGLIANSPILQDMATERDYWVTLGRLNKKQAQERMDAQYQALEDGLIEKFRGSKGGATSKADTEHARKQKKLEEENAFLQGYLQATDPTTGKGYQQNFRGINEIGLKDGKLFYRGEDLNGKSDEEGMGVIGSIASWVLGGIPGMIIGTAGSSTVTDAVDIYAGATNKQKLNIIKDIVGENETWLQKPAIAVVNGFVDWYTSDDKKEQTELSQDLYYAVMEDMQTNTNAYDGIGVSLGANEQGLIEYKGTEEQMGNAINTFVNNRNKNNKVYNPAEAIFNPTQAKFYNQILGGGEEVKEDKNGNPIIDIDMGALDVNKSFTLFGEDGSIGKTFTKSSLIEAGITNMHYTGFAEGKNPHGPNSFVVETLDKEGNRRTFFTDNLYVSEEAYGSYQQSMQKDYMQFDNAIPITNVGYQQIKGKEELKTTAQQETYMLENQIPFIKTDYVANEGLWRATTFDPDNPDPKKRIQRKEYNDRYTYRDNNGVVHEGLDKVFDVLGSPISE